MVRTNKIIAMREIKECIAVATICKRSELFPFLPCIQAWLQSIPTPLFSCLSL